MSAPPRAWSYRDWFYSAKGTLALVALVTAWRVAFLMTGTVPVSFDEGQYWGWAQQLDLGYYSKPPMVAWAIATTTSLCGDAPWCLRLPSPLFHGGTALVLFFLGRRLFDARTGFWTAMVYVTMPAVALSSVLVTTDPPLLFFWALALYAFVQATHDRDPRGWVRLGLALGLGLLSKYAMLFFVLSTVMYAAWSPQYRGLWKSKGPWIAGLIALIFYAPNFYWNAANGFASYLHTKDNAKLDGSLIHLDKLAEFLGSQFGVFGPVTFAVLLWVIARAPNLARGDERWRLLLSFSLPVLALISIQALVSRANVNWAATAYVAASVLVVSWLLSHGRWGRNVIAGVVAFHVAVAGIGYNFIPITKAFDIKLSARTDPLKRLMGWEHVGGWAQQLVLGMGKTRLMFDERKTMATLIYYARPTAFAAVRFNPSGRITDHYTLSRPLNGNEGADFLLITRAANAEHVVPYFDSVSPVSVYRQRLYPDYALEVRAFLCRGFKGYKN